MKAYIDLIKDILENGEERKDRTGTGTISIFGTQTKYDLRKGFPLLTTKRVLFPAVIRELLWFLRGSTNINDDLTQHTPIWDAWANAEGELGPGYGFQWRNWGGQGIDQIGNALKRIQTNPDCRRIIVSAWNVTDLPRMALPPCHLMFQLYVVNGRLDCQMYQRSADMALGVPFNIASYALLLTLMAQHCNLEPGILTHTIGDAHIYLNHIEGLRRQIEREPYSPPRIQVARKPLDEITFKDIVLEGYQHHPFIRYEVSV